MNQDTENHQLLKKIIKRIEKDYINWYKKQYQLLQFLWVILQLTAITAGFATSIISALASPSFLTSNSIFVPFIRTAMVILPALGSLATTFLFQYKILEQLSIRDKGIIEFQNLLYAADLLMAECHNNPDKCMNSYDKLRQEIKAIEDEQHSMFFDLNIGFRKS